MTTAQQVLVAEEGMIRTRNSLTAEDDGGGRQEVACAAIVGLNACFAPAAAVGARE